MGFLEFLIIIIVRARAAVWRVPIGAGFAYPKCRGFGASFLVAGIARNAQGRGASVGCEVLIAFMLLYTE